MIGETQIDGVLIPALLVVAVEASLVLFLLRVILRRLHFYRFVWLAVLVSMPFHSSGVGP
jgi:hypothetical protein